MKKNYQLTFTLLFVIFGAVIVIASSFITYRIDSNNLKKEFLSNAQSITAIKHEQFEKFFDRPVNSILFLSKSDEVLEYMKNAKKSSAFTNMINLIMYGNDDFLNISLYDIEKSQESLFFYDKEQNRLESSIKKSDLTAISQALSKKRDGIFIEPVASEASQTFRIFSTIYDSAKPIGVLSIMLDFKGVTTLLEKSPAAYLHLIDQEGNFLLYKDSMHIANGHKSLHDVFPMKADEILFSDIYVGEDMYARSISFSSDAEFKIILQMNDSIMSEKKESLKLIGIYMILGVILFSLPFAYLFALVPKRLNDQISDKNEELNALNATLNIRVEDAVNENRKKDRIMFHQSKNAAMGEMISMITHQWRQPLSSVSAIASKVKLLAELEKTDQTELKTQMQNIIDSSVYLSMTIEDFKNFFKPDKEVQKVTISDVIDEALKFSSHPIEINNIEVEKDNIQNATLTTYKNELIQVFMNIIKNAVDQLVLKRDYGRYIKICSKLHDNKIDITISDNAGGIEEKDLPHIFDEYYTAKKGGTGLGLYMSRMIITQQLAGDITARNSGEGAEFTVSIPLS